MAGQTSGNRYLEYNFRLQSDQKRAAEIEKSESKFAAIATVGTATASPLGYDVAFMMDGSGSLDQTGWDIEIAFIEAAIRN